MNMATCIKDEMRDLDRYADALRHIPADDREIWIQLEWRFILKAVADRPASICGNTGPSRR